MAFRSASSDRSGGSSTPAVTVPAGVQIDDIVILAAASDSPTASFTGTWPAGFTQFADVDITNDGQSAGVAWKRLTAADAGSYTLTSIGSTNDWGIIALAFSGRHTTDPPVADHTENSSANTSPVTATAPSVTAVSGDDLAFIVAFDTTAADTASSTTTAPAGYTEQVDFVSGGWAQMEAATKDNVSAGATGSVSSSTTLTGGSAGWSAWNIRIPAAGGGGGGVGTPTPLRLIRSNIHVGP